jgi:hypothetical protein
MNNVTDSAQPLVCDLTAIPVPEREGHLAGTAQIFRAAQEVVELPDGFAVRLPNEAGMFMALAHFVENERRCCSFFGFTVEVEPNGGPLWLRMTGGEGVKEAVMTYFGAHLDKALS